VSGSGNREICYVVPGGWLPFFLISRCLQSCRLSRFHYLVQYIRYAMGISGASFVKAQSIYWLCCPCSPAGHGARNASSNQSKKWLSPLSRAVCSTYLIRHWLYHSWGYGGISVLSGTAMKAHLPDIWYNTTSKVFANGLFTTKTHYYQCYRTQNSRQLKILRLQNLRDFYRICECI